MVGSLQVAHQIQLLGNFSHLNRNGQLKLFGSFGCCTAFICGLTAWHIFTDASSARENNSDAISAEEKQNTEKETEAKKEHEQTNKRYTTNKLKQNSRTKQANKETTKKHRNTSKQRKANTNNYKTKKNKKMLQTEY